MVSKFRRGSSARMAVSALLIGLLAVLAPATPVHAATFTVSTFAELQNAVNTPSPVTVVLDADITSSGTGLYLPRGGNVTLDLNGHVLTITGGSYQAGLRTNDAALTIEAKGGGTLNATGGYNGAGIGGGFERDGGTVTINGGTVNATGGYYGAGIGGGGSVGSGGHPGGNAGNVTINAGTVNATGGYGATGIGGGGSDVGAGGGTITIGPDAVVVATSGSGAVVGANGSEPAGSVINEGSLTLHGNHTPEGTFTNEATGVINLYNTLGWGGWVTNHGTIVLATGAQVDYTRTTLVDHAYVIGYDLNGVSGTQPTIQQVWAASYSQGQVTMPTPPPGYAWYTARSRGTPINATTDLPGQYGPLIAGPPDSRTAGWRNVTLHLDRPTVRFEPNNGDPVFTQTVDYETPAAEPADPIRVGYTFTGWHHANTLWDFSTPVTTDLTIAAWWTRIPPVPTCEGQDATVVGTPGDDLLVGTPGPDVIVGKGGNDLVEGRDGADTICAAGGDDTVTGGPGDDHQYGGRGADQLLGRQGDDDLFGGNRADVLRGGRGHDLLDGGPGPDQIFQ